MTEGAAADYRRDLAQVLDMGDVPLPKATQRDLAKIARELDRVNFILTSIAEDVRPYSAKVSILAEHCATEAEALRASVDALSQPLREPIR
jgi:hypothetical protein